MLIYLVLALIAGFSLSNQGPINARLKLAVNSAFWSSTISQIIGTALLAVLSLAIGFGLFPSVEFVTSHPWWIWLGCFLGPIYVTSNIYLFQKLGAVQAVILPILGQIVTGVLIDTFGWFNQAKIPISTLRLLGILITVSGILVAVILPRLRSGRQTGNPTTGLMFWRIWGIFTGGLVAMQQAINGQLGILVGSPVKAGFLSFFWGLVLIFCVSLIVERKFPQKQDFKQIKLWNGLGGLCGAVFVVAVIIAVPKIGTGLNILMALVGQIVGSMLIQQFGWWKSQKAGIHPAQIIGVIIMVVGIIFIKFL
ncbi:DMT family transporter [Lactovum odontotermitis]